MWVVELVDALVPVLQCQCVRIRSVVSSSCPFTLLKARKIVKVSGVTREWIGNRWCHRRWHRRCWCYRHRCLSVEERRGQAVDMKVCTVPVETFIILHPFLHLFIRVCSLPDQYYWSIDHFLPTEWTLNLLSMTELQRVPMFLPPIRKGQSLAETSGRDLWQRPLAETSCILLQELVYNLL